MRVPLEKLEETLQESAPVVEAIQQAQWDKALKKLHRSEQELIGYIYSADPTVKDRWPATVRKGKYAAWLLSQLFKADALMKQADWISQNPDAAVEQGIVASVDDVETHVQDMKNQAQGNHNWINGIEATADVLKQYEKIVRLGQTEQSGIDPDINKYKDFAELVLALRAIPETHDDPDPLVVEGAEIVHNENGVVIFELTTPDAVQFHARDSAWCLRHDNWARDYLAGGSPVYVTYAYKGSAAWENAQATRKVAEVEGLYKLAASSYSSIHSPDMTNVADEGIGWILWEIRDTANEWVESENADAMGIRDFFVEKKVAYPNLGYGIAEWASGIDDYDPTDDPDVESTGSASVESRLSEPAYNFINSYDIDIDEIDEESMNLDFANHLNNSDAINRINIRYLANNYAEIAHEDSSGDLIVRMEGWNQSFWRELERAMGREVLDYEAYNELQREYQEEAWDRRYRDDFLTNLKKAVEYWDEGGGVLETEILGSTYRIPLEVVHDALDTVHASNLDTLWRQNDGDVHWEDLGDLDMTVDTDQVADSLELEEILDGISFDYEEYEVEEEEEDEDRDEEDKAAGIVRSTTESRHVIRRMIRGTAQ
jgi:hypothetical protein